MARIFISIFMCLIFVLPALSAQLVDEDFEHGGTWNYGDNFDLWESYLEDNWALTSSGCHSGYCLRALSTGGAIIDASGFHLSAWGSWGSAVFLKFWARFPTDWSPEATDANGGANHHRYGTGGAGDWAPNGGEYVALQASGGGWMDIYNYVVKYPTGLFLRDNQWHEYAWYIQLPSSASAEDGIWRSWRDDEGTYDTADCADNYTDVDIDEVWTHLFFGGYFKGENTGNAEFWVDDIEIHDSLPSGEDTTPATIQRATISRGSFQ